VVLEEQSVHMLLLEDRESQEQGVVLELHLESQGQSLVL
jgi:hypothetical protein